jgi:Mrp family chromosome partitioning ATPase
VLFVAAAEGQRVAAIAAAFARVAALDGERALLIEGNLRRPGMAAELGIGEDHAATLLPVVEGRGSWRDQVGEDRASTLHLLLAGRAPDAAPGLLAGVRFQSLLAEVAEEYNLVVLDAPPVGSAADALALAHVADAVVLVVGSPRVRRAAVGEAAGRLASASSRPTVAVLSGAA